MMVDNSEDSGLGLRDRVAIVTGAGRGIGAATAALLAHSGARVVLTSRSEDELRLVQSEITKANREAKCRIFPADMSDETQVKALFDFAKRELGAVSVLVNNAAIFKSGRFEDMGCEDWDQVFAVNVRGSFLCGREAFRQMIQSGKGGSIVNISSLSGIRGVEKFPGMSSYIASKHAIIGLTESMCVEGRPHGIRVNCVAPGAVSTRMLKEAAPFLKTDTAPEDVARVICFLANDLQSAKVSGSVIEIFSNMTT